VQTYPIQQSVAKKFMMDQAPPTLLAQKAAVAPIAFTRMRSESSLRFRTSASPPEEAFTAHVALGLTPEVQIWINGKCGTRQAAVPGETRVYDLTTNPIADLNPRYDFLRFYVPVATLDDLAYDRGLRRVGGLRTSTVGNGDTVMYGLALSLLPALENPASTSALFLDSIALAFHAHVIHAYGGVLGHGDCALAGLAPWQLRRAHAFIEAHLDGNPSIADLARECRLSASHFARAFRQATGMPPHRWLTKRRIERAKGLLLEGGLDLAQIALACGFVDQSHLTRVFARHEGHSPGKWRWIRHN
jgi:AraC-like DNA-binding protein